METNPIEDPNGQTNSPPTKNLYGVRGWLLVLCIYLTIFVPLAYLASISDLKSSEFKSTRQALGLFCFGLYFITGILLWRKTKIGLILARAVCVVAALESFGAEFDALTSRIQRLDIIILTSFQLLVPVIWFVYLGWSRRVKVTFSKSRSETSQPPLPV
jgi:DMSO/TMAO reductase YedYZ heme-binding membrane subunit